MRTWGKISKEYDRLLHGGFFQDQLEVTEKLDGSQINFGVDLNYNLWVKSKRVKVDLDNVPTLFKPAVEHLKTVTHKMEPLVSYHGEAFQKPKHNTLSYDRVPQNHIALYGIITSKGSPFKYSEIHTYAKQLGLEAVEFIGWYRIKSLEQLLDLIPEVSQLGGCKAEGIVLKNYDKPCTILGQEFPLSQFKYVTEEFKEKHKSNKDFQNKTDFIKELGNSLCTEARWNKAIQRLKEEDKLTNSTKDIGPLIKYIVEDVKTEEEDFLKEELFKYFWRNAFGSACVEGFPQWYKDKLLKELLT